MAVDHRRARLIRHEPLPREALFPACEEGAGPALGLAVPELARGLFEEVGSVQPRVSLEQFGERPAAVEGEVLAVGEQGIELSLDEGAVLGGEAVVLAAAAGVERLAEMTRACGAWRLSKARTGFHMSIAASWMRAVFLAPSAAKKMSMSASVRPLPPTQIGRLRSRSLTTMR